MNETFSVTPGGQVLSYQPHGFSQIFDVWIDNFSGGWLGIDGLSLWCPPYTRGWKATVFPGTSSITIKSYDFANGVVITGATGDAARVTIWDEPQGDSEGINFFDEQTIPIVSLFVRNLPVAPQTIIAAPTVGRLRIYDIRMTYSQDTIFVNHTWLGVACTFTDTILGGLLGMLGISPASPTDFITIDVPGGDLPIGSGLIWAPTTTDASNTHQGAVAISVRYAVI